MSDIFEGTNLKNEFLTLWEEYKEMKSPEARIVKDADMLDVDMELKEQEAKGILLRQEWKKSRNFVFKKKLYTKSAKKLWKAIQTSNPHDWHRNSRNRLTAGDWRS